MLLYFSSQVVLMNTRNSKSNGINAYADQSAIPKKESVNICLIFNQNGKFNGSIIRATPTGSIADIETRKTSDSKSMCERTLIRMKRSH